MPTTHREVHLIARPEGTLLPDHFQVVERPRPEPAAGQVLVRNRVMNVAAVMYNLIRADSGLPMPPYGLHEPLWAPVIGEVVSGDSGLSPGDLVQHHAGWREYAVLDTATAGRIDPDALPDPAAHLSQGFTAWIGLTRATEVRTGDTVFVSGGAGGVGSLAGQIARLFGATRVIASTGSPEKGQHLVERWGYDAAVLRSAGSIEDQLRVAAPDGIDVMFDNVGGDQLRAGLALARKHARFALVGALSGQFGGDTSANVEIDPFDVMGRGITLRGITNADHRDAIPEWIRTFGQGLRDGSLTFPQTRLQGIDQAPRALCELVEGRHIGTVLVDL